jgi:transposase-like protein
MFIEPYRKLKHVFDNEDDAILYLIENNYINKYDKCKECNYDMKLYIKEKLYKCKNYKCRKAISPFKDTIFSKMKLPINIQVHLLYEFLKKTPSTVLSSSLEIDRKTITKYNRLFRIYLKDKQIYNKSKKIGGRNEIVEIDETKIAKRKYHKGHRVEGAWIIGGIQRSRLKNKVENENKNIFLVPIEERNIENINEIIKKYVKKGTTIYTDCWKGYNHLNKIGYKHKTVNHKKYFKDPITKVHTNTIEGTWNGLKQSISPRNRNKKNIVLHLKEYQWRKKNKENNIWTQFLKD